MLLAIWNLIIVNGFLIVSVWTVDNFTSLIEPNLWEAKKVFDLWNASQSHRIFSSLSDIWRKWRQPRNGLTRRRRTTQSWKKLTRFVNDQYKCFYFKKLNCFINLHWAYRKMDELHLNFLNCFIEKNKVFLIK